MTVRMTLWYPRVGRRRIYRFMKELGIQGKTRHRAWRTTVPDHRPHGIQDHVQRDFSSEDHASWSSATPLRSRCGKGWRISRSCSMSIPAVSRDTETVQLVNTN